MQSLKAVFQFNRIVGKRSVFHCLVNTQAELIMKYTMKYAAFLYDTVEMENGHACDGAERNIKS